MTLNANAEYPNYVHYVECRYAEAFSTPSVEELQCNSYFQYLTVCSDKGTITVSGASARGHNILALFSKT